MADESKKQTTAAPQASSTTDAIYQQELAKMSPKAAPAAKQAQPPLPPPPAQHSDMTEISFKMQSDVCAEWQAAIKARGYDNWAAFIADAGLHYLNQGAAQEAVHQPTNPPTTTTPTDYTTTSNRTIPPHSVPPAPKAKTHWIWWVLLAVFVLIGGYALWRYLRKNQIRRVIEVAANATAATSPPTPAAPATVAPAKPKIKVSMEDF